MSCSVVNVRLLGKITCIVAVSNGAVPHACASVLVVLCAVSPAARLAVSLTCPLLAC